MAYTAKLMDVKADPEFPNVSVSTIQFNKDGQPFGEPDTERGLNTETLVNYCQKKIEHLEGQELVDAYIANPPLGEVDVSTTPSTDLEIAKQNLHQALVLLGEFKKKIDLAVITNSDQKYVEALDDAKAKQVIVNDLQ